MNISVSKQAMVAKPMVGVYVDATSDGHLAVGMETLLFSQVGDCKRYKEAYLRTASGNIYRITPDMGAANYDNALCIQNSREGGSSYILSEAERSSSVVHLEDKLYLGAGYISNVVEIIAIEAKMHLDRKEIQRLTGGRTNRIIDDFNKLVADKNVPIERLTKYMKDAMGIK